MCPISNHKLMPGVSLANHPIRRLFDAGVKKVIVAAPVMIVGLIVVNLILAYAWGQATVPAGECGGGRTDSGR